MIGIVGPDNIAYLQKLQERSNTKGKGSIWSAQMTTDKGTE